MTNPETATKQELDQIAAELVTEKPWKHVAGQSIEEMGKSEYRCCLCGERQFNDDDECSVCETLDTSDANVAFMLLRKAFSSDNFKLAKSLMSVYMEASTELHLLDCDEKVKLNNSILWALMEAAPEQISRAACMALKKAGE